MISVCSVWDDGLESDLQLAEILHKCGATPSFAIPFNTHKNHRILNDDRDSKYGTKLSKNELKELAPFEIVNHGANHIDLAKANKLETLEEITNGKDMLEQHFGRAITSYCYAYGNWNDHCEIALSSTKHTYRRTTRGLPSTVPHYNHSNPFLLHPACKWNHPDLLKMVDEAKVCGKHLIFWGHTYELQTTNHWHWIKHIYDTLKQRSDVKLVSLEELIKESTNAQIQQS